MSRKDAHACVTLNDVQSLLYLCSLAKNRQYDLEKVDKNGNTALLKACYLGRLECAQTLLHYGANVRAINYFGQNALGLATYFGCAKLVRMLLSHCSYAEFNKSALVPAVCVAALRKNSALLSYYKAMGKSVSQQRTVHGLSADDLWGIAGM